VLPSATPGQYPLPVVHVRRCHDVFGEDRQLKLVGVNRHLNAHRRFRGVSRAPLTNSPAIARGASGFTIGARSE